MLPVPVVNLLVDEIAAALGVDTGLCSVFQFNDAVTAAKNVLARVNIDVDDITVELGKQREKYQSLFEKSLRHMIYQGRWSKSGTRPAFRGDNDTRCPVGCLIDTQQYCVSFESLGIRAASIEDIEVKSPAAEGSYIIKACGLDPSSEDDAQFLRLLRYRLQTQNIERPFDVTAVISGAMEMCEKFSLTIPESLTDEIAGRNGPDWLFESCDALYEDDIIFTSLVITTLPKPILFILDNGNIHDFVEGWNHRHRAEPLVLPKSGYFVLGYNGCRDTIEHRRINSK